VAVGAGAAVSAEADDVAGMKGGLATRDLGARNAVRILWTARAPHPCARSRRRRAGEGRGRAQRQEGSEHA